MENSSNQWQQQAWGGAQASPQPLPSPAPAPQAPPQGAYQAPPFQSWQPPAQPCAPAAAQPRQSRGWVVGVVVAVCLCLVVVAGIASCTSLTVSSFGMIGSMSGASGVDLIDSDTVAVIDMSGTIQYDGSTCSPEGLKAQLDVASRNPHIKAVVLRVNSGGGVATAGEEMASFVRDFDKPIVVSSASTNASAAYEISSQADYIFTAKSSAIGAIGTALEVTDLSGLLEKLGISVDTITSADSKDSSYGYRPLTEEERAYYQNLVDQINETFVETVAEGRSMSVETVRELATGMTFTGMEAVENGLADEIGYEQEAVEYAAQLAGIQDYDVFYLGSYDSDLSALLDLLTEDDTALDAAHLLGALGAAQGGMRYDQR